MYIFPLLSSNKYMRDTATSHLVLSLLKGHRADRTRSMFRCCSQVQFTLDITNHTHPLLTHSTIHSSRFNFTGAIMAPCLSSNWFTFLKLRLPNVHERAKSVHFQTVQTYVRTRQRCIFKINHSVLLIAKEVHSTLCDMGYKYIINIISTEPLVTGGSFPGGYGSWGVMLPTHFHLVLRLRMVGATSSPLYNLLYAHGQLYVSKWLSHNISWNFTVK